jgi:hypothetical protein
MKRLSLFIMLCSALVWSTAAMAAPKGPVSGEASRAYGAIDVVLYQTSW